METTKKALRLVATALTALGALFALLMMVHITADVIGRYVFHHPVTATLETVQYVYMVCLVFMPLALVQLDREHLLIEFLISDPDSPLGRIATLFADLIAFLLSGLIAWKTIGSAIAQTRIGEVVYIVDLYLPIWWVRWIVAFAFSFCTLILLVHIIEDVQRFGQPRRPVPLDPGVAVTHAGIE